MARPSLSQKDLWRVTITTHPEAEPLALELLQRVFGTSGSIYQDWRTNSSSIMVYLEAKPTHWKTLRTKLNKQLRRLSLTGVQVGSAGVFLQRLKPSGWVNSWKRHCRAFEVGRKLLIKPSWSRKQAKKGQTLLVIDPGLSFGTGHHPTTRFCLEQIVSRRVPGQAQSFLDIGTGTAILALAAVRSAYAPVEAVEFDPEAIRVAEENIDRNNLRSFIKLRQRDLTRLPLHSRQRYEFICANLAADLLISEWQRLLNRLAPNGFLVLAGILAKEYEAVERVYHKAGLRVVQRKTSGEWRSVCFAY